MENRLQWFKDRIGKKIYTHSECECSSCKELESNGIVIADNPDAQYYFDEESEGALRFFDTPEEVLEFKQQKNYLT